MTAHECIIKVECDRFAYVEQYLVSCQCHMGSSYKTWRPGDPDVMCPDGTVLNTAIIAEAGK